MSLFGSLMGDCEDDPFFGPHMQSMQRMNSMMNSMFADPFGLMGPPAIMDSHNPHNRMVQMPGMQMMPFGFPPMPSLNMGRMFSGLENMSQNPNCHSFSSSSIMTMTSGPDGRPQVYQESMSSRTAPGGVKETKKTVSDSRTGTRKMAIGHHIGERAHIIEREQNFHSGDQEEHQEFINLEEEEAETFNKEWESKTKRSMNAIGGPSYRHPNPYNRSQQENRQLALPSTAPAPSSTSRQPSKTQSRPIATARRAIRPAHSTSKSNNATSTTRSAESTTSSSSPRVAHSSSNGSQQHHHHTSSSSADVPQNLSTTSRKREHSPEIIETIVHNSNKRQSTSPNNSARRD